MARKSWNELVTKARYFFRGVFFLVAIIFLISLSRTANENTTRITKFKFKMIENLRTGLLDSNHKLDLMLNETAKFADDSFYVRIGIEYFICLLVVWACVEFAFLVLEKEFKKEFWKTQHSFGSVVRHKPRSENRTPKTHIEDTIDEVFAKAKQPWGRNQNN